MEARQASSLSRVFQLTMRMERTKDFADFSAECALVFVQVHWPFFHKAGPKG